MAVSGLENTIEDKALRRLARVSSAPKEQLILAENARTENPERHRGKHLRKLMPIKEVLEEVKSSNVYLAEGTYLSISGIDVNWVMCDEGHLVKGCLTATQQLIPKMKRNETLIVTATPLLNQRSSWPFKYSKADLVDVGVWYEADMLENVRDRGEHKVQQAHLSNVKGKRHATDDYCTTSQLKVHKYRHLPLIHGREEQDNSIVNINGITKDKAAPEGPKPKASELAGKPGVSELANTNSANDATPDIPREVPKAAWRGNNNRAPNKPNSRNAADEESQKQEADTKYADANGKA
ncbi:hypothetical protein ACQKWADRAFT_326637 [Trichoderma austrokoningii]